MSQTERAEKEDQKLEQIQPHYLYIKETETLNFTPLSFLNQIYHLFNHYANKGIDLFEKRVGAEEVEIQKVSSLLYHAVDKAFDQLELFALNRIFILPKTKSAKEEVETEEKEKENVLSGKALKFKKLKKILKAKLQEVNSRNNKMEIVLSKLDGLKEVLFLNKNVAEIERINKELSVLSGAVTTGLDEKVLELIKLNSSSVSTKSNSTGKMTQVEEEEMYREIKGRIGDVDISTLLISNN